MLTERNLLGGVYCAYPYGQTLQPVEEYTPAPDGYIPFYISHYGRHGSRYQPNDSRYANTLKRLTEGHNKEWLTPLGENLLNRIQILCDSCLGHGGLLTSVGARQHESIARRMYHNFPEVFRQGGDVSARSSVVKRCCQSMHAFLKGLNEEVIAEHGKPLNITSEVDSAYMAYIAYDTPEMRSLSSKTADWQKDYAAFMQKNVDYNTVFNRIFTNTADIDVQQTVIDLYWLTIGMQNLDLPFNLDDVFTPEELLSCYECVNYRMYVCNANSPISNDIPAKSASSLLQNIIETADTVIKNYSSFALHPSSLTTATLRFGHDSNILRLFALMQLHNSANRTESVDDALNVWQECVLSPMGANLQLVFYRNKQNDVLVKILLNEHEILVDNLMNTSPFNFTPVKGCYYHWYDLRRFWMSQIVINTSKTDFLEPVQ